jgi:uncharacterized protein YbaR (Trm112 family)
MYIELTDHLRCPEDHEESFLVLLPDRVEDRSVRAGQLGCPVCGRTFTLVDGVVDVGGAPDPSEDDAGPGPDALTALVGLGGPGGYLVVVGGPGRDWRELAERNRGVGIVLVNPPAEAQTAAAPASFSAVPGAIGEQDVSGPYEVQQGWPKDLATLPGHDKWTYGSARGIFAESPNRVFLLGGAELPALRRPPVRLLTDVGPNVQFPIAGLPWRNANSASPPGAGGSRHADSAQANHSQPNHDDILAEAVLTPLQRVKSQNKEMGEYRLFGRNVLGHRSNNVVTRRDVRISRSGRGLNGSLGDDVLRDMRHSAENTLSGTVAFDFTADLYHAANIVVAQRKRVADPVGESGSFQTGIDASLCAWAES